MVLNILLGVSSRIFFADFDNRKPARILIYHVGNIGDIVVATPVYRSIHKSFPETKVTLLTSPGKKGLPGAQGIISPLKLVDNLRVYYPEENN